jgi:hypothetical protein
MNRWSCGPDRLDTCLAIMEAMHARSATTSTGRARCSRNTSMPATWGARPAAACRIWNRASTGRWCADAEIRGKIRQENALRRKRVSATSSPPIVAGRPKSQPSSAGGGVLRPRGDRTVDIIAVAEANDVSGGELVVENQSVPGVNCSLTSIVLTSAGCVGRF